MKTVELRRHTDNDGDQLSERGVADARAMGERLSPPYDAFVSTGARRTTETLEIWRSAVGATTPIEEDSGLRSQQEDRWKEAYQSAGGGELSRLRDADPELVREDAAALGAALRAVLDRLPDGGQALVCGHSPTNEAAVLGLTGDIVDPIGKGAGVRVTRTDDGSHRLETAP